MAFYQVEITKSASKGLRGLDRRQVSNIVAALESLERDPRPNGCKRLAGSEHTYRIRVGDHRVIYDIQDDRLLVLVVKIRHRRDAYR